MRIDLQHITTSLIFVIIAILFSIFLISFIGDKMGYDSTVNIVNSTITITIGGAP